MLSPKAMLWKIAYCFGKIVNNRPFKKKVLVAVETKFRISRKNKTAFHVITEGDVMKNSLFSSDIAKEPVQKKVLIYGWRSQIFLKNKTSFHVIAKGDVMKNCLLFWKNSK